VEVSKRGNCATCRHAELYKNVSLRCCELHCVGRKNGLGFFFFGRVNFTKLKIEDNKIPVSGFSVCGYILLLSISKMSVIVWISRKPMEPYFQWIFFLDLSCCVKKKKEDGI